MRKIINRFGHPLSTESMRTKIDLIENTLNKELTEYNEIPTPNFSIPDDLSGSVEAGNINTRVGTQSVWVLRTGNLICISAMQKFGNSIRFDRDAVTAILTFERMSSENFVIARNAYTVPGFERQSIQAELFLFANKVLNFKIFSDTELSPSGEALWDWLVSCGKFDAGIAYVPTGEIFNISDIGQKKTSDGVDVISPKADKGNGFFSQANKTGQKFFYLLEGQDRLFVLSEDKTYEMSIDSNRHVGGLLQPHGYFFETDAP